jgi:hypothetical protein
MLSQAPVGWRLLDTLRRTRNFGLAYIQMVLIRNLIDGPFGFLSTFGEEPTTRKPQFIEHKIVLMLPHFQCT